MLLLKTFLDYLLKGQIDLAREILTKNPTLLEDTNMEAKLYRLLIACFFAYATNPGRTRVVNSVGLSQAIRLVSQFVRRSINSAICKDTRTRAQLCCSDQVVLDAIDDMCQSGLESVDSTPDLMDNTAIETDDGIPDLMDDTATETDDGIPELIDGVPYFVPDLVPDLVDFTNSLPVLFGFRTIEFNVLSWCDNQLKYWESNYFNQT
jgi:hypothetical protein